MAAKFRCDSCGHETYTSDKIVTPCPKCGSGRWSGVPSSSSQMTVLESPPTSLLSRHGTSSTLLRIGGALPAAIGGYQILSLLGSGGMGSVFLAYDTLLDGQLALKVLARSTNDAQQARNAARSRGAVGLYISATPSENTVHFYQRRGALLLRTPDAELFVREPEDIHLECPV